MCIRDRRRWEEYLSPAEDFINLACHQSTNETPYTAMFEQRPPREITEIINFPLGSKYEFNKAKFYNNAVERADKLRLKYKKSQPKIITCLLYTSRCV